MLVIDEDIRLAASSAASSRQCAAGSSHRQLLNGPRPSRLLKVPAGISLIQTPSAVRRRNIDDDGADSRGCEESESVLHGPTMPVGHSSSEFPGRGEEARISGEERFKGNVRQTDRQCRKGSKFEADLKPVDAF